MAKRKADDLAGKGSLADRLRRRREAVESGNLEAAAKPFQQNPKKRKK